MHFTNTSTTRTLAASVALIAAICVAMIAAAGALAGSGGIGPRGSGGADPDEGNANLTPEKYERLWERVSEDDRRWANRVAQCETGRDPNLTALGGDYRGAFMFTWDAWKTSPKSPGGDPIDYTYRVQAVVAVALKARDGTAPWPVCG